MKRSGKRKIVAGTAAVLALAGGGAAIGATQWSPKAESDAVVKDAAEQLGVEPSELSAALKKALEDRVDAAVAAGRLTQAQADELKQRIESGDVPLVGGPLGGEQRHEGGHFGGLDAAGAYLGLSESDLHTQLESGKTLADVAKAQGKTADGLVTAIVDAAKKDLADAVAAWRMTEAQQTEILADLEQRTTDLVNGKAPTGRGSGLDRFRGGPPEGPSGADFGAAA